MAEEVKITVIATGFRQGSPERREHMLSAALRPGRRRAPDRDAPPTPRFASEETEAPQPRLVPSPPILVPVSSREFVSAFRVHDSEAAITEVADAQEFTSSRRGR